jgi:hypothetical protein
VRQAASSTSMSGVGVAFEYIDVRPANKLLVTHSPQIAASRLLAPV